MNGEPEFEIPNNPLKPIESRPLRILKGILDYVEVFAVAILVVLFVFSFCLRLCRVDGDSMNNTLEHTEMLITRDLFYEPEQGDIIVFHLCNGSYERPLVKRVIATEGQQVLIDLTEKAVYVDGVRLTEEYVYLDSGIYNPQYFNPGLLSTDENGHRIFTETVSEGKLFVMGDNRNHSADSRSRGVGLIDADCVLGKVLFRISPFTVFH